MSDAVRMKAVFDPRVKIYWYFQGLFAHFMLIFTGLGFLTFPAWAVFGLVIVHKRFEALSAELTDRAVHMKSGVLFKVEKTIPLEKIQDLSLRTGPLLNAFGLASVQIETAGASAQGMSDMALPGLSNATEFRNAVLEARDRQSGGPALVDRGADENLQVLREIRDSLRRIEAALGGAQAARLDPERR